MTAATMKFYRQEPGDIDSSDIPAFPGETVDEAVKQMGEILTARHLDETKRPAVRPHHARLDALDGSTLAIIMVRPNVGGPGVKIERVRL